MTKSKLIETGQTYLGLEFGSTRIKAVLIDEMGTPLETGGYDWENQLVDGVWTYDLEEVWAGAKECFKNLSDRIKKTYGVTLCNVKAIGVSGMMHGYLPFDKNGDQISIFRTWRNNMTAKAAEELTTLFDFNIPQRWSIAHLYHSVLREEEHVKEVDYITTLSGYVHWKLTGKRVIGIGEASGMFPIDSEKFDFASEMIEKFDDLVADKSFTWKLKDILPRVLVAGEDAGTLTEEGARLLDPSGNLKSGIRMCPPEGDAGTGMVATNSVAKRTGNISAGTSAFAMIVLEKRLSKVYTELDMVTTPAGAPTAMAHSNNCSTDLNVWMNLLNEALYVFGVEVPKDKLYKTLFEKALEGDMDCGALLPYCFHSGEHVVGLEKGCPMFIHPTTSKMSLANFMRANLNACFGAMKIGVDIMMKQEKVRVDKVVGHGGIFKTKGVAQRVLSSAFGTPVDVMETAGEGGPWGMAILAAYMMEGEDLALEDYLHQRIFNHALVESICATEEEIQGFEVFMDYFRKGLSVEYAAVEHLV